VSSTLEKLQDTKFLFGLRQDAKDNVAVKPHFL
jgi:hypothetical protein